MAVYCAQFFFAFLNFVTLASAFYHHLPASDTRGVTKPSPWAMPDSAAGSLHTTTDPPTVNVTQDTTSPTAASNATPLSAGSVSADTTSPTAASNATTLLAGSVSADTTTPTVTSSATDSSTVIVTVTVDTTTPKVASEKDTTPASSVTTTTTSSDTTAAATTTALPSTSDTTAAATTTALPSTSDTTTTAPTPTTTTDTITTSRTTVPATTTTHPTTTTTLPTTTTFTIPTTTTITTTIGPTVTAAAARTVADTNNNDNDNSVAKNKNMMQTPPFNCYECKSGSTRFGLKLNRDCGPEGAVAPRFAAKSCNTLCVSITGLFPAGSVERGCAGNYYLGDMAQTPGCYEDAANNRYVCVCAADRCNRHDLSRRAGLFLSQSLTMPEMLRYDQPWNDQPWNKVQRLAWN